MRRILGFIAGFGLAFYLLIEFFSAIRGMPRGPFWVFLCIAAGYVGSRLASRPKENLADAKRALQPMVRPWWTLDSRLRLAIVVSSVWIVAAYFMQDEYDKNMSVVFIPAVALLALHFFVRTTVESSESTYANTASSDKFTPLTPQVGISTDGEIYEAIARELETGATDKALWTKLYADCDGDDTKTKVRYIKERMHVLRKVYTTQAFAGAEGYKPIPETDNSVSESVGAYPYGITLVDGQYQFDQFRYDKLKDAVAYAERTIKN
jgi:hypothetical protein